MNKAAFLDRDGIINYESGHYACYVEDFLINEGVGETIKLLKDNDFIVIIISNQGGIAKGLYTENDLLKMHIKLCEYLSSYDTIIDDFFYCPHHPDFSNCLCRKPNTLMFEKAIATYNIDPKKSFMLGDGERDIESAEKCGIKGFLVKSNQNIFDICNSLIINKI
ncbi:MAG: HAD family hydrolase [Bacteroidales bacterium]|jgi:D-glycero-D-manno-heptose 1,7-bisphosphate phosphatase|nr:HAD family hydrolase [Bacteroidales bacterium]